MKSHTDKIAGILAAAAVVLSSSCAKQAPTIKNETNKMYFDSWMQINYPDAERTELGAYILDDKPGTGESLEETDTHIFVQYTSYDLEWNVSKTTDENLAKQLGTYSEANWYGDDILGLDASSASAGVLDAIKGMKIGGTRTAVIPGWINTTSVYDTEEEYLDNCTGTDMIFTITITGKTSDIEAWEVSQLEAFSKSRMEGVDSTYYGYYYQQLKAPSDTASIPNDSTFRINYTGRLMNGRVFDTTIKDTAKFYGIYSPSKDYAPVYITKNEDYTQITLSSTEGGSGSTVVDGFSYCLFNMKKLEKGRVAFFSNYGYGSSGQGNSIPKYAPLSFDIELVGSTTE